MEKHCLIILLNKESLFLTKLTMQGCFFFFFFLPSLYLC